MSPGAALAQTAPAPADAPPADSNAIGDIVVTAQKREEKLQKTPAAVQVIGVPDARYGEELMAWIKVKPGSVPPNAATIREVCTGRLAHYKIPRYVHIPDEFPMTVTGKVGKVEMRESAIGLLGLEDAAAIEHA